MIILPLSFTVMGCGDACDDAADKMEECYPDATVVESGDVDCTGKVECEAECINDASCDDITSVPPATAYTDCLVGCG
ncbi:MAG: hypothetical protein DRI90_23920 [Deltaproteobacteria bacterium]|nr:MAG: hypothetical protein DRI90_23920 [Deltaproteobacteria bacterium]